MNHSVCRRRLAIASLTSLLFGGAYAAPRSCYRAMRTTAPGATGLTLILIDTTTAKNEQVVVALRTMLGKALNHAGERVLVASFAGMVPGQYPAVLADVLQEPQPSPALESDKVLDWSTKLRVCLAGLPKMNRTAVLSAMSTCIGRDVTAPYSEIIAGVRWALTELLPSLTVATPTIPVRVVVFSDGEQNSRSGMTFYKNGAPRDISADKELDLLSAAEKITHPTGNKTAIDVWWLGLGLQPPGQKFFMTPQALAERKRFWSGVLKLYGARKTAIGFTLTDDNF